MSDPTEAQVQVVRGNPRPEEVAAVVAAIRAVTSRAATTPSSWAAYWRSVRRPVHPEPDGWRRSARPR